MAQYDYHNSNINTVVNNNNNNVMKYTDAVHTNTR